ncbi:MAG: MarR family transcriptional regulator [Dehalococcoidia bacterium]|nr:MarR family transcriptional regulator [Dehalococcoidia bacterium]
MPDDGLTARPVVGLLLRLLAQRHGRDVDAALTEAGFDDIRPPHANVFPFVPPEGIQVGALARLAGVRKQSMAQSVAELERAGYVERRPDPTDRRARLVFLTERGRGVPSVAVAAGRRVEAEWADVLGAAELEHLRSSLRTLLNGLQERER